MKQAFHFLGVVVFALLAMSWVGRLHPVGDSLAVARPLLTILAVAYGVFLKRWVMRGPVLALAAVSLVSIAAPALRSGAGGAHIVYQKNLLYWNDQVEDVVADIIDSKADILMLQEVAPWHQKTFEHSLRDVFPTWHVCGAVIIASKLPGLIGTDKCLGWDRSGAVQVQTRNGPAWIISLHLLWPWPKNQPLQVESLVPMIEGLEGPTIIGGDFNMVPWSDTIARLENASNTRLIGPIRPTFWIGPYPLVIDQILAPNGGRRELRPRFGSDHYGLVGYINDW